MINILLVGSGAREHAIAKAIEFSKHQSNLFCFSEFLNPKINELTKSYQVESLDNSEKIFSFALKHKCELVVIGPEKPLASGVADKLWNSGIKVIGPKKQSAKLETDKGFTRDLLNKYKILANPQYKSFTSIDGIAKWLENLGEDFVIKANGLAGGKGVKVSGKHLTTHVEALKDCEEFLKSHSSVVVEEKLIGQEFSLHSFVDGKNLVHMPVVQDHKAAFENDEGPNTGGMGSFSDSNHKLPFLTDEEIASAQNINEQVIDALFKETGEEYKGILYGSYIATKNGIKVIEFNARFGDPECLNLLSILDSDFIDICNAMVNGTLNSDIVKFKNLATVCKYLVPEGYPESSQTGNKLSIDNVNKKDNLFYASVIEKNKELQTMSSRTMAYVSKQRTISEAYIESNEEIAKISGKVFYRKDIGRNDVIDSKIKFMDEIRSSSNAKLA